MKLNDGRHAVVRFIPYKDGRFWEGSDFNSPTTTCSIEIYEENARNSGVMVYGYANKNPKDLNNMVIARKVAFDRVLSTLSQDIADQIRSNVKLRQPKEPKIRTTRMRKPGHENNY